MRIVPITILGRCGYSPDGVAGGEFSTVLLIFKEKRHTLTRSIAITLYVFSSNATDEALEYFCWTR